MLQNISLIILLLSLLASPAFGGGMIRQFEPQANSPDRLFRNHFNPSPPSFKNDHLRFHNRHQAKTRIPGLVAFPYYGIYRSDNYGEEEKEALNIIVDTSKKVETAGPQVKKEKPVSPPHMVTLEDKEYSKDFKPAKQQGSVAEIRGTQVSMTKLPPE